MHAQSRADTLENFFKLVLVLHLNSVCLLFNRVSQFARLLVETKIFLQNLWFWNVGCLFPICPFFFFFVCVGLSSFPSSLPFVFAISFFPFNFCCCCSFLLGAVCTMSLLSPLPKHWDHCSSFPNITRLILTLLIGAFLLCSHASGRVGGKCEEIRQSRDNRRVMWEQRPGMWSGKWLNNRMSHETQYTWEMWQLLEPQKVVTSAVTSCSCWNCDTALIVWIQCLIFDRYFRQLTNYVQKRGKMTYPY